MSTSITAVLGVTELLEAILNHLPMTDLLRASQVSKNWKGNITNSHKLQQALFLTPSQHGLESDDPPHTFTGGHPLQFKDSVSGKNLAHVVPNPQADVFESTLTFNSRDGSLTEQKHEGFLKMLVAQPPPTAMRCSMLSGNRCIRKETLPLIVNPEGITIGDIYRKMEETGTKGGFRRYMTCRFKAFCSWEDEASIQEAVENSSREVAAPRLEAGVCWHKEVW